MRRSLFDQSRHFFRPGDVNRVTGPGDFDLVAIGTRGIPSFEVGIDYPVCSGYDHPARFASPRRRSDGRLEIVSRVEHLGPRHEGRPFRRKVGSEVLTILSGI